jgi:ketosteroid isomerase-like protein
MAQDRVEAIRGGIEAFNRRDFDAALAPLRDDVTWERFLSRAETGDPVVRGKDDLLAVWRSQVEAIDIRFEPREFIEASDSVIVVGGMVAHGSGSDIDLSTEVTWMWTFAGGQVSKVQAFESRDEALAAAGASEPR